jgi:hypothetical protein
MPEIPSVVLGNSRIPEYSRNFGHFLGNLGAILGCPFKSVLRSNYTGAFRHTFGHFIGIFRGTIGRMRVYSKLKLEFWEIPKEHLVRPYPNAVPAAVEEHLPVLVRGRVPGPRRRVIPRTALDRDRSMAYMLSECSHIRSDSFIENKHSTDIGA